MGELDTLRISGRAARVDECQDIVAADRLPCRVEVEAGIGAGDHLVQADRVRFGRVNTDRRDRTVCGCLSNPFQELGFGHQNSWRSVAEQVGDLVHAACVVDRKPDGAEVHHRGVDEVKLRAVGQHDADGVTAPYAECDESGGELTDLGTVLRPGVRDGAVRIANGGLVAVPGDAPLEVRAQAVRQLCLLAGTRIDSLRVKMDAPSRSFGDMFCCDGVGYRRRSPPWRRLRTRAVRGTT